jgi:hypothetical protein
MKLLADEVIEYLALAAVQCIGPQVARTRRAGHPIGDSAFDADFHILIFLNARVAPAI